MQVELPRQLDRCDHVRMKILGDESTWLPFREKRAITEALRLVGATEQAGYLVRYPIGSEKVQWLPAAIYIATETGLFAFQRTSGWDEPGRTADGTVLEPWSTHGAFTPWHEVSGAALRLSLEWNEKFQDRVVVRTLHFDRPATDIDCPTLRMHEPEWIEFVQAAFTALAQTCLRRTHTP